MPWEDQQGQLKHEAPLPASVSPFSRSGADHCKCSSHGIVLAENQADYVPVYSDAVELVGDIVELELEQDTAVAQGILVLLASPHACRSASAFLLLK